MVRVGSLTSGFDHDLHCLISDRVIPSAHRGARTRHGTRTDPAEDRMTDPVLYGYTYCTLTA